MKVGRKSALLSSNQWLPVTRSYAMSRLGKPGRRVMGCLRTILWAFSAVKKNPYAPGPDYAGGPLTVVQPGPLTVFQPGRYAAHLTHSPPGARWWVSHGDHPTIFGFAPGPLVDRAPPTGG